MTHIDRPEPTSSTYFYPNPVGSLLFFSGLVDKVNTIKIVDMVGNTVRVVTDPHSYIDLSGLRSWVYVLEVYVKDGRIDNINFVKR